MDKKYTFEMFWEDLDNGFQIYYTYMDWKSIGRKRSLVFFNNFLSDKA